VAGIFDLGYYDIHANECMICGRCNDLVNAHIWPKHTHGENLLSIFGLAMENLNDPRNYLRLSKSIEVTFDKKTMSYSTKWKIVTLRIRRYC